MRTDDPVFFPNGQLLPGCLCNVLVAPHELINDISSLRNRHSSLCRDSEDHIVVHHIVLVRFANKGNAISVLPIKDEPWRTHQEGGNDGDACCLNRHLVCPLMLHEIARNQR